MYGRRGAEEWRGCECWCKSFGSLLNFISVSFFPLLDWHMTEKRRQVKIKLDQKKKYLEIKYPSVSYLFIYLFLSYLNWASSVTLEEVSFSVIIMKQPLSLCQSGPCVHTHPCSFTHKCTWARCTHKEHLSPKSSLISLITLNHCHNPESVNVGSWERYATFLLFFFFTCLFTASGAYCRVEF